MQQVGIYGIGSFGYALLRHLEQKAPGQIALRGFDRNDQIRAALRESRRHPYHEAATAVSPHVAIVDSVADLLDGLDVLVLAVTSESTRQVVGNIAAEKWSGPLTIVNTAKALDFQTGRRLSEITFETLGGDRPAIYAALAGGTIAGEVHLQEPLGMTIACEDSASLGSLKKLIASATMWVQASGDLVGVEMAGAFKNVIAICAGMARGLKLPYGSVTHLISRMACEAEDYCVRRMGASAQTFRIGSPCWGSDMWMSCMGPTRNSRFGQMLGEGKTLEEAMQGMSAQHKTIEGVQTLRAIGVLLAQYSEELRLMGAAEQVILRAAPAATLLEALSQDRD